MMRRPIAPPRRLSKDARGIAALEFAMLAPVMCLLMMGLGDMLYQLYAKSLLNGAVQKAARDATIQGGAQQTDALDQGVIAMIGTLMAKPTQSCVNDPPAGSWCSTRKSYSSFAQVGPEPFTDLNSDGIRQAGECYSDVNGNKRWDADPGASGQGGANDVALYTMRVTYPRIFPVAGLFGWPSKVTISTSTLLKNQPYASQTKSTVTTICT